MKNRPDEYVQYYTRKFISDRQKDRQEHLQNSITTKKNIKSIIRKWFVDDILPWLLFPPNIVNINHRNYMCIEC